MELISYVDLFIGALLNTIFYFVIVNKIFNIKTINNKKAKYIIALIIAICLTIINIFNKNTFKAVLAIPLVAIGVSIVFDIKFTKSLYSTMIASFYLLIGDMIIGVIFPLMNLKLNLSSNILGSTIGNVLVIFATYPLTHFGFMKNIFKKLFNIKISNKMITFLFICFLMIGSAFVFKSSIDIDNIISIIMNLIIFIVFIFLLYISYTETQKVSKISEEYNSLLNYLDNYEKQLVEKKKLIHDFKNQLIVIRGYAEENEKLKDYLKGIIDEHKSINETKIVRNIYKLPSGLKGLVYYKLSQIHTKLKVSLNVNSKFSGFNKLLPRDNKNILKITGILLDNAIESALKTKEKYIYIEISMYKKIFKINIVNSCVNNIEKSKLYESGFSTKGKNRGYGLSLVKDIIRNDDRYNLELDIEENDFKVEFSVNLKEK